ISGFTYSDDFPTVGTPYDPDHNGSGDIYVSKFSNDLLLLTASTFIGGANYEESHAIAIDAAQNVFIAGYTGSMEYPSTPGVYDDTFNENHDAIITKLDNDLTEVLASTFIGGAEDDDCYGLVIEGAENVFITGITFSEDYPVTDNAFDNEHNGERDIFVSRFSFDLSMLLESTYLGGGDNDWALDLAIDNTGSVFVGGGTYSDDFPIVGSPYDDSFNGREDAIVAKITGCGVNDLCDPANTFGSIFIDIEQEQICNNGCNASATPGPMNEGGCYDFPYATVWYTFTPEVDRACIKITMESEELPQPQMAIFQGACPGDAASMPFTCDTGSSGSLTIRMGVEAGATYYIAVSDATGAEGYFDLCVENNPDDALSLDVVASDLQCFESRDGSINLTVNNATGAITYDWNDDALDGNALAGSLSVGTYFVQVTDENNCTASSDSILLSQPDPFFVDLMLDTEKEIITYGDTVLAIAEPSIPDDAIRNIVWTPPHILAEAATDGLHEQYISPLTNTDLIVTVEDSTGCYAADTLRTRVTTRFPFFVPNVFAPQGGNRENAIFRPFVTNKVQQINFLRVCDRWGNLVYESNDFPTGNELEGWDGSYRGQALNPGVFIYFIEVEFINGAVQVYSGDVTLVR
ncbi:MAG: gliding motility-associated C-terminal domain-containing protein, partial [Bacteroidota bacterium]